MKTKKRKINPIVVFVIIAIIITAITTYFLFRIGWIGVGPAMKQEEIIQIYENNKQRINNIKDSFFESDFIPSDGETSTGYDASTCASITIYYRNEQLIFFESGQKYPVEEKFKNIQDDALDFFKSLEKGIDSKIVYGEVFGTPYVEFVFYKRRLVHGIVYTTIPEELGDYGHVEDNWYMFVYGPE